MLTEYQELNSTISSLQAKLSLESSVCNINVLAASADTECPVCGSFMSTSKTSLRHIQTMVLGKVDIMEQHRWCPNGCRDADEQLIHHRSESLFLLVKPGCNIGYDVECYIGRQIFIENRQAIEVHKELQKHNLDISLSEVYHLADKFLDHLEGVHFDSAEQLRNEMMKNGGYVAHIDATCDKGRGSTFVVLSGWDRWALIAGRIDTEHHESITPLLQRARDIFGAPVGFMRDMGKAMQKAIDSTTSSLTKKPGEFVCHFHFGKDVGKDILYHDHEALLSLFRKAKLKKKLQDYIKTLSELLKGKPVERMVTEWAQSKEVRVPAGDEGLAVIRSFAQRILDYGHDESMKKFPFTRPYLELYDRCCSINTKLNKEMVAGKHAGNTKKYIIRLQKILLTITESDDFRLVANIIREKATIFDRLRSVLRLDSEDGCISKADEAEIDPAALAHMERDFEDLIKDLKEQQNHQVNNNTKKTIDIILTHIEEHGKYLWGHKKSMVTSEGDTVIRYVHRTNNVLECYFRPAKRNIRRRGGCADVGYALEHTKASIFYIGNLMSQNYLDIVYGGSLDNLQNRFALYDIIHSVNHERVDEDSFSATKRGSLSSSEKRIIRSKKYLENVV